jgi:high-affinity K+ transport system ATPase subunit B
MLVAMNSGTQAAKEAGNMVDLDNDPTKLIEIIEIGKQLLMTRGTLTTFLLRMMWQIFCHCSCAFHHGNSCS